MADDRSELLQGTLETLVLRTLAIEPMHGSRIAHRIEQMSKDVFLVTQGSLYPALIRMKRRGWLTTSWRVTENSRRARYYESPPPAATARRRAGIVAAHVRGRRLGHEPAMGARGGRSASSPT